MIVRIWICIGILFAIAFSGSAAAGAEDIRLIAADRHGLTVELTTPPFRLDAVPAADGLPAYKPTVEGWAGSSLPGTPDLPSIGALIEVPDTGEMSVEVLESSYETIAGQEIAPVPKRSVEEGGKIISQLTIDRSTYDASEFFPASLVEISPRSVLRGSSLARLTFHPFRWNPATKELRCHNRILAKIRFDKALTQTLPEAGSPIRDLSILNAQSPGASLKASASAAPAAFLETEAAPELTAAPVSTVRIKVEINRKGVYRIGYDRLVPTGKVPPAVNPSTFRLFHMDNEVAIRVSTKTPGVFATGDFIEFYAEGLNTQYTDTNVYFLYWGGEDGKRVQTISGKVTGTGVPVESFYDTLHFEKNNSIWEATPGAPEQDYWFWDSRIIAAATRNYSVSIPSPAQTGSASAKVCMRGYTSASINPDHHTKVSLNSSQIGDQTWDGPIEHVQESSFAGALLLSGANTLSLNLPGDTGASVDSVYMNWIEIGYQRLFEAVSDELAFTVDGGGRRLVEIGAFSVPSVRIYDITDPYNIKAVVGYNSVQVGSAYKILFEDTVDSPKKYFIVALAKGKLLKPPRVKRIQPTNLKSSKSGADYIIITPFWNAAVPLRDHRKAQGLRARLINIERIYDEFNFGILDPKAIKDFLKFAYDNWRRPAPTYILLLGDANADYRNYFGLSKKSRVPVHLSYTPDLGVTPDDNWYAAVAGDDALPDMFIGRIPASSAAAVTAAVNKIIAYEQSTVAPPKKALFVADNDDTDFESVNNNLKSKYLPADYTARNVYLRSYAVPGNATLDIISYINEGMLFTNYVGHGHIKLWAAEKIFQSSNVPSLNNPDYLTFVSVFDCLSGYFSHPAYYSIAEELFVASGKGSQAVFAPSGLGYTWEHRILSEELYRFVFTQPNRHFGYLTTQAKLNAYARGAGLDTIRTFTLIGDPASILRIAE